MCERTEPTSELYCIQVEKNSGKTKINNNILEKIHNYRMPEGQCFLLVAKNNGRTHPSRTCSTSKTLTTLNSTREVRLNPLVATDIF